MFVLAKHQRTCKMNVTRRSLIIPGSLGRPVLINKFVSERKIARGCLMQMQFSASFWNSLQLLLPSSPLTVHIQHSPAMKYFMTDPKSLKISVPEVASLIRSTLVWDLVSRFHLLSCSASSAIKVNHSIAVATKSLDSCETFTSRTRSMLWTDKQQHQQQPNSLQAKLTCCS